MTGKKLIKSAMLGIACALLAMACGREKSPELVTGVTPVWKGSMQDRPELARVYDETYACLHENFGYVLKAMPTVILSGTTFTVYDGKGYMATDRIGATVSDEDGETVIYLDVGAYFHPGDPVSGYPLKVSSHEDTHYVTGMGNEGHGTAPFLKCSLQGY